MSKTKARNCFYHALDHNCAVISITDVGSEPVHFSHNEHICSILRLSREEREAYPRDPEFLEEVRAIDENLSAGERQEEYERLLKKYNVNDLIKAVLRMEYDAPDSYTKTPEEHMQKTALHEAGHLVVCEVLCPGSVGIASLRSSGRDSTGGFIRRCKEFTRRPYHILVSLAGKAAVELYYSNTCASGCKSDINRAFNEIRTAISESGTLGFCMIDVSTRRFPDTSENMNARNEAVVCAELERYMLKARHAWYTETGKELAELIEKHIKELNNEF